MSERSNSPDDLENKPDESEELEEAETITSNKDENIEEEEKNEDIDYQKTQDDHDHGDRQSSERSTSNHSEPRSRSNSPPRKKRHIEDEREQRDRSRSPRSSSSTRRKERSQSPSLPKKKVENTKEEVKDLLRNKTGGAYIPPAKLKMLQEQISDKSSEQYQRFNWERLKKKFHGLVNKVNVENIVQIVRELLQENVLRGKGLLTRSIIQAQAFSPGFSHVYSALVAVINSKFPNIGELLLRRLIVQFKRSFRRNDKGVTVTVVKFIAHLINQQVAHEVLGLEIMLLMLEAPTDDSVEVAIAFLKECGAKLMENSPAALNSIFDRLRAILSTEEQLEPRVLYMIEVAMQIRKDKFEAYPSVIEDLDLIEEEDQITHTVNLEEATDPQNELNIFKLDPEFEENEKTYDEIRAEIVGDADISSDEESDEDSEEEESGNEEQADDKKTVEIIDNTEQHLVAFRRSVYLTLQSSLDYQEAAHKILKMGIKPELENELCNMLVDCCAQQRTYERFYGMLIERFCRLRLEYQETFEQICRDAYATVHRFDITKLRNLARLVSHLLCTDAIDWKILGDVKMTEEDTTSSGRIYIKYIFQELVEAMGIVKLYERVKDPTLSHCFVGLFPRDNPQNARFAINYFTMIGLGGLTLDLRKWLEKGMKKKSDLIENQSDGSDSSSSSSSSDSSDSSDSDSDSDSDSSSDSSDSSSDSDSNKKIKKEVENSVDKRDKARTPLNDRSNERDRNRVSGSIKDRERTEETGDSRKRRDRSEEIGSRRRRDRSEEKDESRRRRDRSEEDRDSRRRHDRSDTRDGSRKERERPEEVENSRRRRNRSNERDDSRRRRDRLDEEDQSRRRRDRSDEEDNSRRRRDRSDEEDNARRRRDRSDEEDHSRRRRDRSDEEDHSRRRRDRSDEEDHSRRRRDRSDEEDHSRRRRDRSDEEDHSRRRRDRSDEEDHSRRRRDRSDEEGHSRRRSDQSEERRDSRRRRERSEEKESRRRRSRSDDRRRKSRRDHSEERRRYRERSEEVDESRSRRDRSEDKNSRQGRDRRDESRGRSRSDIAEGRRRRRSSS